ncbi:MAG TPA: hypothetical protein VH518_17170 [Tepidisphaeraceae bacterium]|jgi:hypothetical protein
MKRRLFTLLSAVSLLLCMATVGLWVRSYWAFDVLTRFTLTDDHALHGVIFWTQHGSCALRRSVAGRQAIPFNYPHLGEWQWNVNSNQNPLGTLRYGFIFDRDERGGPNSGYYRWMTIGVPLWLLAIFFAVCPTWWLVRELRRRAALRAVGRCKNCGYDLRATPDRCPECGLTPSPGGGSGDVSPAK